MNPTELNAFIHTKLGRQGESLDYCGNRDAADRKASCRERVSSPV